MSTVLAPLFILLLFVVVRAGDLAITAAMGRDTIRAVCYGVTALLALISLILTVFGIH